MKIRVLGSYGTGKTSLSAFDKALFNLGLHDYNLITLSSIIPPDSQVSIQDAYQAAKSEHANRLYVVLAEQRSDIPGTVVGAALGWYQKQDGSGVFVEHSGTSTEVDGQAGLENNLASKVMLTIQDLCTVRGIQFDRKELGILVRSGLVKDAAACCALVVAVYYSEGWGW